MIKLNNYINEAWGNMKQHTLKSDIEAWCEEMGMKNYTINSKGEIDLNGDVNLDDREFKELPYKFGIVGGYFSLDGCKNLISLKNCPDVVRRTFYCRGCKRKFTEEEVKTLCKVKGRIVV